MVIGEKIVPFITEFVDELDDAIAQQKSQKRLSKTQKNLVCSQTQRQNQWRVFVEAYSQRWVVEVFIQGWKANEGWATLTKLQGEKGSRRGLILSLLVDHCLFFHPDQKARFKNKLPAFTVGCLRRRTNLESLFLFITDILDSKDPYEEKDHKFSIMKENLLNFKKSEKHMVTKDINNYKPTKSLKYKKSA